MYIFICVTFNIKDLDSRDRMVGKAEKDESLWTMTSIFRSNTSFNLQVKVDRS